MSFRRVRSARLNLTQLNHFWKFSELRKLSDFSWVELSRVGRSQQGLKLSSTEALFHPKIHQMSFNGRAQPGPLKSLSHISYKFTEFGVTDFIITCHTVVLQSYRRQAIPMEQEKIWPSVTLYSLYRSLPNLVRLILSATPTQMPILVKFGRVGIPRK